MRQHGSQKFLLVITHGTSQKVSPRLKRDLPRQREPPPDEVLWKSSFLPRAQMPVQSTADSRSQDGMSQTCGLQDRG
ncbi:Dynein Heavy Chain 5, Axonemal [Manis pentadactyla]|nr:Dynein Heavy Chain 5, Axonemal [Manis pentadactyla]